MSRRKQAKPQHLKSDEELPPQDGASEHGEGRGTSGWPVVLGRPPRLGSAGGGSDCAHLGVGEKFPGSRERVRDRYSIEARGRGKELRAK